MSRPTPCPACQDGHHERHVGPWNVREGLIGGDVCHCTGDCKPMELPDWLRDGLLDDYDPVPSLVARGVMSDEPPEERHCGAMQLHLSHTDSDDGTWCRGLPPGYGEKR